jgi:hypothetical protein
MASQKMMNFSLRLRCWISLKPRLVLLYLEYEMLYIQYHDGKVVVPFPTFFFTFFSMIWYLKSSIIVC